MFIQRLALIVTVALLASACAQADSGNDWQLRIKKEGDGWTATFNGTQEYGPAGKRIRGSGTMVERTRSVAAFTKLRLEGPMDVRLNQAGTDAVRVLAEDNIEPLVESRVEGDTLVLRLQPGAAFSTRHAPTISVDSRSLQGLSINGSGDVSMDRFSGDSLGLTLTGSGDLRIGLLEVRELNATLHGSGDVRVAGKADTQSWSLYGSGDVDARSLAGRSVKAQLSGSGDMSVGVTEKLDVSLSGSGDLSYAGRPELRQSVTGSGEVSRR